MAGGRGGGLTLAAVRHRPRQALLVVLLAAVVGAAATIAPLWSRAVEQSLVRSALTGAAPADRDVVLVASGSDAVPPGELGRLAAATAPAAFARPVTGAVVPVEVARGAAAAPRGAVILANRGDGCGALDVVSGSCPAATGEVLLSRSAADYLGVGLGGTAVVTDAADPPARQLVRVVGLYQPALSERYWAEPVAAARAAPATAPVATAAEAAAVPQSLDPAYATYGTLERTRTGARRVYADLAPRIDAVTVADAPALVAAGPRVKAAAQKVGASVTTRLADVVAGADEQRSQARQVVPLLAAQVGLLAVVVLAFVCAAATEVRRPEVALARLRGQGTGGALGVLLRELGALVLAGVLLGAAVGVLATRVAVARWLAPGVALEGRPAVLAGAVLAVVGSLAAVALAAVPTLRQPLTALLRRVPPRASAVQVGAVEGGLVAATAAGLVTLLAGDRADSPVALLVPGLLAVAGGLLLGQLVVPAAASLSRGVLRRGRVTTALAGIQLARRPALRRLIAIVTVASALLVFAADTWAVSSRNRTARAGLAAGAPVVLQVDAHDAATLRSAVLDLDPRGRFATPVVQSRSVADVGARTTAVEPAAFARIARWGDAANTPGPRALRALVPDLADPLPVRGDRVVVAVDGTIHVHVLRGRPPPPAPHVRLVLAFADPDGHRLEVDLGPLRKGPATYAGRVACTQGCLLRQVAARRPPGDTTSADIAVHVTRLAVGAGTSPTTPVDLGPAGDFAAWLPVPERVGDYPYVEVDPRSPLTFSATSGGESLTVQHGDVVVSPPALVAGRIGAPSQIPGGVGAPALAPGLAGTQVAYDVAGRLHQVPRAGGTGVLVALAALDRVAGPPTASTTFSVWLARDDPASERRLRAGLAERGVTVIGRDTVAAHRGELARQGPALGLRLGLLGGGAAVLLALAALVVGVATSGPARARDLAGLRISGVGAPVVRRASVAEHVVVAALGVLAGSVLGLVAAQTALGQMPLLAGDGPELPPVRDAAWPVVLTVAGLALAVLGAVAVLVGRALAAAAVAARLRDGS